MDTYQELVEGEEVAVPAFLIPGKHQSHVRLCVDGRVHVVCNPNPKTTLAEFLRRETIFGTSVKIACAEGGCGSCAVIRSQHCPSSGDIPGPISHRTINACLAPICSLDGSAITTAQGLGGLSSGFNAVQVQISDFLGSQCGFCTPGIVVTASAALHANGEIPDAETLLDGNLCRCTGYRPILDALRSFNAPSKTVLDVEALASTGPMKCSMAKLPESQPEEYNLITATPESLFPPAPIHIMGRDDGCSWHTISSLLQGLRLQAAYQKAGRSCDFVAGSTASGLYKGNEVPEVQLFVGATPELRVLEVSNTRAVVGGAITLAEMISSLSKQPHALPLVNLLHRVAGQHVRSAATIGGNLHLARERVLPSDPATPLAALGTSVTLAFLGLSGDLQRRRTSLVNYLLEGWPGIGAGTCASRDRELLESLEIPLPSGNNEAFLCGKVAARPQNAHSYANLAVHLTFSQAIPAQLRHRMAKVWRIPAGKVEMEREEREQEVRAEELAWAAKTKVISASIVAGVPVVSADVLGGKAGSSGEAWRCVRLHSSEEKILHAENVLAFTHKHRNEEPILLGEILLAAQQSISAEAMADSSASSACLAARRMVPLLLSKCLAPFAAAGLQAGHRLLEMLPLHGPVPSVGGSASKGLQYWEQPRDNMAAGEAVKKDTALLQTSGQMQYTDDLPLRRDTCYGAYVQSSKAHADLLGFDTAEALNAQGVVGFVSARDCNQLMCQNQMFGANDEEVFVSRHVRYHGQPVALVVAETPEEARSAAKKILVKYGPPTDGETILTVEQAVQAGSLHLPPPMFAKRLNEVRGDPQAALKAATQVVKGTMRFPAQLHMYMETQTSVVRPTESGGLSVVSGNQGAGMVQDAVAEVTGLPLNQVHSETRRLGGAFGGKATRSVPIACAAAVAAQKFGREVRLVLDRAEDSKMVGGRPGGTADWEVGFNAEKEVVALCLEVWLDGGAYADSNFVTAMGLNSTVMESYGFENVSVSTKICKTHKHPCTTMRGPGKAEGTLILNSVLERAAHAVGVKPVTLKESCMWKPAVSQDADQGDPHGAVRLQQIWAEAKSRGEVEHRQAAVDLFNMSSAWKKRGLALSFAHFSCMQGPHIARVKLEKDGTVLLTTDGVEMGQGLHIKAIQVASGTLGRALQVETDAGLDHAAPRVPFHMIRVTETNSASLSNLGITGGSTTSEVVCEAVRVACDELVERLQEAKQPGLFGPPVPSSTVTVAPGASDAEVACAWKALCGAAGSKRLYMQAEKISQRSFMTDKYHSWGAAVTEVEVDGLTGETCVLRSDIVFDAGRSLNPAVDIGQVEGAYLQGIGMMTSEEVPFSEDTLALQSSSTWNYKIPAAACTPRDMRVHLLPVSDSNPDHPCQVLGSKATGEPPLLLASGVMSAIRDAVAAIRAQSGLPVGEAYKLDAPATVLHVQKACGLDATALVGIWDNA